MKRTSIFLIALALMLTLALCTTSALAAVYYSGVISLDGLILPVEVPEQPAEGEEPIEGEEPAEGDEPAEDVSAWVCEYQRDETGALVLNDNGDPVVIIPEGAPAPIGFERDETGALILDENGNPVAIFAAVEDDPAADDQPVPVIPSYAYEYQRDETGALVLNDNGDPIVIIPEGAPAPIAFERNEDGTLALDEAGNPIAIFITVEDDPVEGDQPAEGDEAEQPAEVTPAGDANLAEGEQEAPAPAASRYEYQRDETGALVLDASGNPIVATVPDGMEVPVTFQRDANGNLVLDANGDPIVTATLPAGAEKMLTLADQLNPDRYIDVYAYWDGDTLTFGDTVTLIAVCYGYDNAVYTLQWQRSTDDATWADISGANGDRFSFVVDEDNYDDYWRVTVIITDVTD